MTDIRFDSLGLAPTLLRAIREEGHERPTPIQARAIPAGLEGRDVLGVAQTGTGKTAAFVLPMLQRLGDGRPSGRSRPIRALVLSPTRELAAQIGAALDAYGRHTRIRHTVIYGGVRQQPQVRALRHGVDILVATPGRLADLMRQGEVSLDGVEMLVLDEADRMLDQGFLPEVRRLLKRIPRRRQTLFFSATLPDALRPLVEEVLHDPVTVRVTSVASTPTKVEQSVYFVDHRNKPALLEHLLEDGSMTRAIVFTRTKRGADKVAKQLVRGEVRAEAIHGNKSQNARDRSLSRFKKGRIRVLVATDVASRGIDVDGISHVVNFDVPNEPESYVHRVGRTARAGADGKAISFCSGDERRTLKAIERLLAKRLPVVDQHPFAVPPPAEGSGRPSREGKRRGPPGRRGRSGRPASARRARA